MISSSLSAALALVLCSPPRWAEEEDERIAVFTAPLAIGGTVALSSIVGVSPMAYVPLGINFTYRKIEWSVDVALVYLPEQSRFNPPVAGYAGIWASFGPVIHTGRSSFGGAFFTPKLTLGGFIQSHDVNVFDVLLGGEAGYQFTFGQLYLAFVVGASVGVGLGETDAFAGPWLSLTTPFFPNRDPQPVIGLNLDLLRLGYVF